MRWQRGGYTTKPLMWNCINFVHFYNLSSLCGPMYLVSTFFEAFWRVGNCWHVIFTFTRARKTWHTCISCSLCLVEKNMFFFSHEFGQEKMSFSELGRGACFLSFVKKTCYGKFSAIRSGLMEFISVVSIFKRVPTIIGYAFQLHTHNSQKS